MKGRRYFKGLGLLICMYSFSLWGAIEPGFRDRLRIFPPVLVNDADSTIKDLGRKYAVQIEFETGEGPILAEPSGIKVRIPRNTEEPAQVVVGEILFRRGLFTKEDAERLKQVVGAYSKESLVESAIYGGIQFLSNTFEARVRGVDENQGWERTALSLLVFAFVAIAVLVFLLDAPRSSPTHSSFHHPF